MYISWHMVGAQSTERNSFIRAPENSRYHMTGFLGKAERKAIHPINTERIGFGLTRPTMLVRAGSTQSCKGLKGHSYLFSQGPDLFSLLMFLLFYSSSSVIHVIITFQEIFDWIISPRRKWLRKHLFCISQTYLSFIGVGQRNKALIQRSTFPAVELKVVD